MPTWPVIGPVGASAALDVIPAWPGPPDTSHGADAAVADASVPGCLVAISAVGAASATRPLAMVPGIVLTELQPKGVTTPVVAASRGAGAAPRFAAASAADGGWTARARVGISGSVARGADIASAADPGALAACVSAAGPSDGSALPASLIGTRSPVSSCLTPAAVSAGDTAGGTSAGDGPRSAPAGVTSSPTVEGSIDDVRAMSGGSSAIGAPSAAAWASAEGSLGGTDGPVVTASRVRVGCADLADHRSASVPLGADRVGLLSREPVSAGSARAGSWVRFPPGISLC